MADEPVRSRHKEISRSLAGVIGGMGLALSGVGAALMLGVEPSAPPWLAIVPFGLAALTVGRGILESVVRTTLTDDVIEVQKGLSSLRIPLASVSSATTTFPTPVRGAALFMAGSRGVLIEWTDASGTSKTALVGAEDPSALAADIRAACAALRPRARVEMAEEADADAGEAEREEAEGDDRRATARKAR